ncbi:hypothetical protein A3A84_00485 [Candidatus Collierbacteria bacterium RIFCSPLOWO2_01_FULL_50_23]|uniref:Uncharacterized protein n=1 Tax=Candidatus Collierbacteria bacterium RIFCSPHIGHO2_02_FULL_49_10 TaxID=1817723 RepID=A0A1F5EWU1_9BACT|nr:MAG: hypothetical protein A3D09_02805 [Candidatus Collierbacteria bacterium RIFCSPHIGHO2_02_FULL_49_10]OGD73876.1 MAG: hypothetical protein A3A84_00485 [Candidatus Collierbacteria bacterium RIFCSPLOWO2_01_FULL_50_23]
MDPTVLFGVLISWAIAGGYSYAYLKGSLRSNLDLKSRAVLVAILLGMSLLSGGYLIGLSQGLAVCR